MTDTKDTPIMVDGGDEHSAAIPEDHIHFSVLEIVNEAITRFRTKFGKYPKYLYAPEPLCYMIDRAIKAKMAAEGAPIPRHAAIVNVGGMEMIVVPGTCTTLTAKPLHEDTNGTPPIINAPHPSTVQ